MKVTFIVPVFNIEKYLEKCVNSILTQTYKKIEVILVDDGSTDKSGIICDSLAVADSRVKVIHKQNGGLSDARNTGLLNATGDYVIYIDGDDYWMDIHCLENLINEALKTPACDFIGFNCSYYYPETDKYVKFVRYSDLLGKMTNKNFALEALVKSGTVPMSACLKLIKRKFLIENNLNFIKGITAEDIPWFIDLLDKAENVIFVNQYIYAYRQNVTGSITQGFSLKSFDNLLTIIENEIVKLKYRSFDEKAKNALLSFLAFEYIILLGNVKRINKRERRLRRKKMKQYTWLLNYTLNPKVGLVHKLYKMVGLRLTECFLGYYLYRKRNKASKS